MNGIRKSVFLEDLQGLLGQIPGLVAETLPENCVYELGEGNDDDADETLKGPEYQDCGSQICRRRI
jgi:hypothetical protein